jgi:hypothetical protein
MRLRLKLVPDSNPDADGEWVEVAADEEHVNKAHRARGWIAAMVILERYNPRPRTHHIVSYDYPERQL